MALVGCTVHDAHLVALAAIAAHDGVQRVTTLVHLQAGSKAAPTMATVLQALRRSKTSPVVPGTSLRGVVRTVRQPWGTASLEVVDPAPPGDVLHLVWERLWEDDEREAAELPDVDPVPLDPLPSTVRVVCVLDPAVRRVPAPCGCLRQGPCLAAPQAAHGGSAASPPPMQAVV